MKVFKKLNENFVGQAIDDPIDEQDIDRFEEKWHRSVPIDYRDVLLHVNGIHFDKPVVHNGISNIFFLSLAGMNSVLESYGDYMFPFFLPVAHSVIHGSFALDVRERKSAVYRVDPINEPFPERFCIEKVSETLEHFVDELVLR